MFALLNMIGCGPCYQMFEVCAQQSSKWVAVLFRDATSQNHLLLVGIVLQSNGFPINFQWFAIEIARSTKLHSLAARRNNSPAAHSIARAESPRAELGSNE